MSKDPRRNAIHVARQIIDKKPIYLDTETTGTDSGAEIVEIAILDHDGHTLYDSLIHPNRRVPVEAYNVHHIGDAELEHAPTFREAWTEFGSLLTTDNVVTVIYNADFDARMIRQCYEGTFGNLEWAAQYLHQKFTPFCAMKLYAQFYGEVSPRRLDYKWQSLEKAGAQCGIKLPNSHRAADDARLARAILHHMANQEV